MKITLNKADVIEKARAGWLAGKLQCQQSGFVPETDEPIPSTACRYSGPCVIGIGLTPEQQEYCDAQVATRVRSLWYDGHIDCSKEDMEFFDRLQTAHDCFNIDVLNEMLGVDF